MFILDWVWLCFCMLFLLCIFCCSYVVVVDCLNIVFILVDDVGWGEVFFEKLII